MTYNPRNITLPPGIFMRGGTYSLRYAVPKHLQSTVGKREVVKSLRTSDLTEALALRDRVIREIEGALSAPKDDRPKPVSPKGMTISQAGDKWLSSSDGIKRSTKERYQMHLKGLVAYAGDIEVSKIDRALALSFIDHIRTAPSKRTGQPLSARSIGAYPFIDLRVSLGTVKRPKGR